ncbi:DUF1631 domain-containing protein [Gilvimarinus sp. 1_MG-2023]|uniref:DUF1631 domain-containing protein n=1 Tax=Gilvimarinus sp. 1_MG-2023 TaxID=3062638 RepID=UPI0026E3EBD4|nr:DUF1631 domain-containing protein [Gilvimarinus sp. 1_MG-2023]MDO6746892.1 DUF1631 domain-containing protein [Gilvimarinus sp. 1_MG-2023]
MTESSNSSDKVVKIGGNRNRSASGVLTRMPAALHQMREKAKSKLAPLLGRFFEQADDALFSLADQASNNHEQNAYFDSMRALRLSRKSTEDTFFATIDKGLAQLLDPALEQESEEVDESIDSLSLVGKEELEDLVAGESMMKRANEEFAEKIQHLNLRIDQLVPVKVYNENNPVGPAAICNAFFGTAAHNDLEIKARLVLYKLFDRTIMQALGGVYDQLNEMFVEANILPSLSSPTAKKKPRPSRAGGASASRGVELDEGAEQVLNSLRELMGSAQVSDETRPQVGQTGTAGANTLCSEDLLGLLTLAQRQAAPDQTAAVATPATPAQISTMLTELLQESGKGDNAINQVDADVINLVSMMFEFILDDRNLASSMKVLLGKLQIPLVKVAIADKTFFGKGGHPARRLLNEMATAALGWQELTEEKREKDALYQKVSVTVDRVLAEYEKNVDIFDELLLDFRGFQERDKRRAKILEQRTIDAEDGKARSQRARAEVDAALEEISAGHSVPQAAAELLSTAWANVLFVTCLKEGADSENFNQQIQTARQLIWSVTVDMTPEKRQKLLKLVPRLLTKLRTGLEEIAFNPYQMGKLFKSLEKLHLQVLRGQAPVEPAQAASHPEPQAEAPLVPAPASSAAQAEPTVAERVHREAIQERSTTPAVKPVQTEPTSQQSVSADAPVGEAAQETIDGQTLALVSNLSQGAWFEMTAATGESYRCRLAAIIKPTGKYIFVNRTGMKVAEKSKEELAISMRDGKIRLLDDGMLFDRALESVIGNLRQSRS